MTRTPKTKPSNQRQKALLYCRVSDPKQKHDGHGLESQEQRIRQFAEFHQFEVEQVFHDDVTGGGDFNKRPAMTRLLDYLKAHCQWPSILIHLWPIKLTHFMSINCPVSASAGSFLRPS
ncbi:recombinase family protein [Oceanobacter antarcticus]|uniref:Recombinase family protein n=1 Tax=Oceanobacter antarcticus TaxID=3133425 RepID=A0ABW8NPB1_9GAMM